LRIKKLITNLRKDISFNHKHHQALEIAARNFLYDPFLGLPDGVALDHKGFEFWIGTTLGLSASK
jgi:hypothetical protein